MNAMVDHVRDASSLGSQSKKNQPKYRSFDISTWLGGLKLKMQTDQLWPINDDDGAAELCACISRLESRDGGGA